MCINWTATNIRAQPVERANTPLHFDAEHFCYCWFYMKQLSTLTSKFYIERVFELNYKIHN